MGKINIDKVIANSILLIISSIMLIPLLSIVNISLKTDYEFLNYPSSIVKDIQWQNFFFAWQKAEMGLYFKNSIILAGLSALLGTLISALAGFPLGRQHFKGAKILYSFILASLFFPGSLVAIIFLMRFLGLYNTTYGVILLLGLTGLPINIFMITGFVKGIPRELDEAAFIDGCPYFRYMFSIAFPLMKPILATVFVFRVIGAWNDFITPFLFLLDKEKRPLTAGLYLFKGTYVNNWTMLAASIIIIAVPLIILYVLLQKYIIEGMTSGAVKG